MQEPDRDEAALLKSLRLSAGLEPAELGALVNLSAGQIRQLEDGGDSLFYSPQIKAQAMRRVTRHLESPQPSGKPTKVQAPEVTPRSTVNVIDDIIRLSEKNLKGNVVSSPVKRPMNSQKLMGFLAATGLIAGVYFLWAVKRDVPQAMFSQWVQPLTQRSSDSPTSAPVVDGLPVSGSQQFKDSPTSTTVVSSALDTPNPATASNAVALAPVAATTHLPADSPAATVDAKPSGSVGAVAEPVKPKAAEVAPTQPDAPKAKPAENKSEQTSTAKEDSDCASIKSDPVAAQSVLATKPGDYIYMQAVKAVQICVEDAQRHRTVVSLEAGTGRSIHGSPPWVIASRNMKSVQIYFQGAKVPVQADTVSRIILKEQAISP